MNFAVSRDIPQLQWSGCDLKRIVNPIATVEAPSGRTPLRLRDRAILRTLYATGIRASELMQL